MLAAAVAAATAAACTDRSQPGGGSAPPANGGTAAAPSAPAEPVSQRAAVRGVSAGEGEVVTSVALPTGERATSLLLVEHVGPEPGRVRAGEEFAYRIRLTNLSGSCALEGIVVRQHLASGLEVVAAEPAAAGREGDEQVWRLDPLDPGASTEIRATGVVPTVAAGQSGPEPPEASSTCVRVTYVPALCAPLAVAPARIELVREAPEVWTVCDLLPVTYRITNRADEPIGPITIREPLPEGLVGGTGPKGEVEVRVAALGPGVMREETVQLRALRPGAFPGRAVAVLEDGARVWSAATVSTAAQAALAVAVDAPEVAQAGDALRYTVAVTNSGNGVASGARVQVRAAASAVGAGGAAASGLGTPAVSILDPAGADVGEGFAVVPLGDIAPGTTAYTSFTLCSTTPGELATTVEAVAPCSRAVGGEPDQTTGEPRALATVATRLIAATPITLDVTAEPNPVAAGNEVVFQIMLINHTGTSDRNVSVGVVVPPGLAVIEAMGQTDQRQPRGGDPEGESAAEGAGGTVLFEPLDRLLPGQRATWYIRAVARERGEYRVAVEVTSEGLPRPLSEIERTAVR